MKKRTSNPRVQRILEELEYNRGTFPRRALGEAIANRHRITPELLHIIKQAKENLQKLVYEEDYVAHFYAMYLLAQFREARAYPLIVDFFSIPGEITLDLMGDMVTEDLGRILASVSHGDTSLMEKLVENERANEYVRNAALRGMVTLWAEGEKPRDELTVYFQSLFRGGLEREYSYVWDGLVSCCTDLYPEEVLEDIEQAFKDDLIDEMSIDLPWVRKRLALGKENVLDDTRRDRHHTFIRDTVKEMEWWVCFDAPEESPVVTRKVGRNEPCPCGSGRKYKRCCGARK